MTHFLILSIFSEIENNESANFSSFISIPIMSLSYSVLVQHIIFLLRNKTMLTENVLRIYSMVKMAYIGQYFDLI